MLLGLDVRRDAASNARAASPAWICKRPPDTPPVDVFLVSRQVSWLAGRRRTRSSQCVAASVTQQSGATHCLQLRGQRRTLAGQHRDAPTSLLATKSCDTADRDVYMWCYSGEGVNGVCETFARNFKKFLQSRQRGRRRNRFCRRLEELFPDIPSEHSPVTSWRRAQSAIASRRFATPGRSGERRAARNPDARRPCSPSRSALHSRS
jgi:hypothetical protein